MSQSCLCNGCCNLAGGVTNCAKSAVLQFHKRYSTRRVMDTYRAVDGISAAVVAVCKHPGPALAGAPPGGLIDNDPAGSDEATPWRSQLSDGQSRLLRLRSPFIGLMSLR